MKNFPVLLPLLLPHVVLREHCNKSPVCRSVFYSDSQVTWPIAISKCEGTHLCLVWFFCAQVKNRRRHWQPTPVLLPGKSHGRRSLVGCSPWCREESDMTEWLHFHFSLSCIGEGNGNPLQCSCLENPRDGGAWWAAVSGVAQSRAWLKQLSSSSKWKVNIPTITSFLDYHK